MMMMMATSLAWAVGVGASRAYAVGCSVVVGRREVRKKGNKRWPRASNGQ